MKIYAAIRILGILTTYSVASTAHAYDLGGAPRTWVIGSYNYTGNDQGVGQSGSIYSSINKSDPPSPIGVTFAAQFSDDTPIEVDGKIVGYNPGIGGVSSVASSRIGATQASAASGTNNYGSYANADTRGAFGDNIRLTSADYQFGVSILVTASVVLKGQAYSDLQTSGVLPSYSRYGFGLQSQAFTIDSAFAVVDCFQYGALNPEFCSSPQAVSVVHRGSGTIIDDLISFSFVVGNGWQASLDMALRTATEASGSAFTVANFAGTDTDGMYWNGIQKVSLYSLGSYVGAPGSGDITNYTLTSTSGYNYRVADPQLAPVPELPAKLNLSIGLVALLLAVGSKRFRV